MKRLFGLLIAVMLPLVGKAHQMTVIIVIDQFSWHYIPKLRPFLKGGIQFLSQRGTTYSNAFYDHSMPGTGPGHTMLATGTYGSFHGIVNNRWWDREGKIVQCDDDTAERAAVFKPDGTLYDYGKSARNIMVDTLSDQLMLHSYPHAHNIIWSLSLKSRAAIPMAGRLGKAIWLDYKTGNFTSSKAYFSQLPSFVKAFNEKHKIGAIKEFIWKPFFPSRSAAYRFKNINNYSYSSIPHSIIGRKITIDPKDGYNKDYSDTPLGNKALIDLAIDCIDKNYTGKKDDHFILWLSLSSLDKIAHAFGPDSKEAIDMVYHMDHQLQTLINHIYSRVKKEDVLFLLTADHGVQPIAELLKDQGLDLAKRYDYRKIITDINTGIEKKYGIKNIIQQYKEPQFYLDQKVMAHIAPERKKKIYQEVKSYMLSLRGIRRVWTFDELKKASFAPYDLDKYLQNQLYQGRSGDIIFAVEPYTTIDTHIKGTSHIAEYAYDTHVPLIFYQPGRFMSKRINTNVYMPQVSVTLATLFETPRPSASAANVLPGLKL